jgi:membrane-associated phospholipid phosphatase
LRTKIGLLAASLATGIMGINLLRAQEAGAQAGNQLSPVQLSQVQPNQVQANQVQASQVQPNQVQATAENRPPMAPAPGTESGFRSSPDAPSSNSSSVAFASHIADFLQDQKQIQKQIWSSPFQTRLADAPWLIPVAGVAAGLFVTDRQYSASIVPNSATIRRSRALSNYGVAALGGAGAGLYLFSFPTHNEHWRETGFLAGEAALNTMVTAEVLKYSLGRERPYGGAGAGRFFQGGTSFPSEQAAVAWSIAGVIAHEYSGTFPRLLAYGVAYGVSFSRVRAREHFPSDVFVGSLLGYFVSRNVYTRHHDAEVGGGSWESPRESATDPAGRKPSEMGSPYVPLESWIYPAFARLAALGYLKTASLGVRPWTRLECARLLSDAAEPQPDASGEDASREDASGYVQQLYDALAEEFAHDSELISGERNLGTQVESVYFRSLAISGKPLTDNYHFGQTILNDYGRPYQQGFNSVAGSSGWTTAGPFVIYVRGEFQSAPSAPAPSPAVLDFISASDGLPPNAPSLPIAGRDQFRLLDTYVGMTLANWQVSYGKRSLWWGPSEGGTLIFTNNAPPLNHMFSIDRVSPFQLPWFLRCLGEIRASAFIGQLAGQEFLASDFTGPTQGAIIGRYGQPLHPQPFLSGGKISFKLTENFEFGMAKTTIYGGPGNPLTPKTFVESTLAKHVNGDQLGDGRSSADFAYRIPGLRDSVTFYGEAFSEDEPSPIPYMRKSAFQGGLYFPLLPNLSKLDLRIEGGTTSPVQGGFCTSCFYTNGQYVNGYTNDGQLIGTWVGRAAQGEWMQSNYWLSPRKKIGMQFRHRKIDRQYLPQGGTQNDVAVDADIFSGRGFRFSGNLQYERWQIPLLGAVRQSDLSASIELGFWPGTRLH